MSTTRELSPSGREQLALALLLLKNFKSPPPVMDVEVMKMIVGLADHVGVRKEFEMLLSKVPPMRITPMSG